MSSRTLAASAGRPFRLHQPINRGSPGALSDARRTPFGHPGHQRRRLAGCEDAALLRGEPRSRDPLHRRSAPRRTPPGRPPRAREQLHEHHVGHTLHIPLGRRREPPEGGRLRLAAQTRDRRAAPRSRNASAAGMGRRTSSGAIVARALATATLHDEAAPGECPGADGRALPSRDRPGQLRAAPRRAVEVGQGAGDRQAELGAGAEPAVRPESPDAP